MRSLLLLWEQTTFYENNGTNKKKYLETFEDLTNMLTIVVLQLLQDRVIVFDLLIFFPMIFLLLTTVARKRIRIFRVHLNLINC